MQSQNTTPEPTPQDIVVPTPGAQKTDPAVPRSVVDRRMGLKRVRPDGTPDYTGPERRKSTDRRAEQDDADLDDADLDDADLADASDDSGLKRRRGAGIRRADDRRQAEEGEMTPEQFEFVMAVETYKKVNRKMFPTWTEVLEVITQLGYRKVQERDIKLENVPEAPIQRVA